MNALTRLFNPIDISVLVYFRIVFGIIMFIQVLGIAGIGWSCTYCTISGFLFSYYGFDWVTPLPEDLMFLHILILGITSIFVIIGFKYRISTI